MEYFASKLERYRPHISQLVDHIDYIVKLVEMTMPVSDRILTALIHYRRMDDVTKYPLITEELKKRDILMSRFAKYSRKCDACYESKL